MADMQDMAPSVRRLPFSFANRFKLVLESEHPERPPVLYYVEPLDPAALIGARRNGPLQGGAFKRPVLKIGGAVSRRPQVCQVVQKRPALRDCDCRFGLERRRLGKRNFPT